MNARALASIALALVAFPALLNAHLGLAWHGVAEAALGALVLINLLEVARTTVARRRR